MGYGTTIATEDLKGSGFAPRLTAPYLGPAKLVSGGAGKVGKDDAYDVIKFTFAITDPELRGVQYENAIFEPTDDDAIALDEKIDKMKKRVAYILKYFVGEELALQAVNAAKNYAGLQINVGKALGMKEAEWKDKEVQIKVLGSVYNGKTKLEFPGYLGFIADDQSESVMVWSKRELEDCRVYTEAVKSAPSSSQEVGGTTTSSGPVSVPNSF